MLLGIALTALTGSAGAESFIRLMGSQSGADREHAADQPAEPKKGTVFSDKHEGSIQIISDRAATEPVEPRVITTPVPSSKGEGFIRVIGDKPSVPPAEKITEKITEQVLQERLVVPADEAPAVTRTEPDESGMKVTVPVADAAPQQHNQDQTAATTPPPTPVPDSPKEHHNEILTVPRQLAPAAEHTHQAVIHEQPVHVPMPVVPQPVFPIGATAGTINQNDSHPADASEKPAATADPQNIWDLYLAAKKIDPALGRSNARVAANKADKDVIFSGLLPHLDANAGVKLIQQTLINYSPTEQSSSNMGSNYSVTARMTLFHVPTLFNLSAARASLRGELAGVAIARQNLILRVADAYFTLLKCQADKQIAEGEITRLKQVLEQAQAFLKAGTGDIISVYEAQSRLDSALAELSKSESALKLAEQKLSTTVGRPVSSIVDYTSQQPMAPDPDEIGWWLQTMEKEQPLVRQAREALVQTAEQKKSAKAEYLPVLQATGGYDISRGSAFLPNIETRQWTIGASLSLPIYSGGETAARIRRAAANEEERQHIYDETLDQQRENLKQAFFNLRYNVSYIKALEQKKSSAEIQLAAIKKGRKIGTRSAIDLLNAEQSYSIAIRDLRSSLYDNVIKVLQLRSAAGILTEDDLTALVRGISPPPITSTTSQ